MAPPDLAGALGVRQGSRPSRTASGQLSSLPKKTFLALSSLSSLCRIMSFNHHDLRSEVLAQGDLRRASCVAALRTDGQHVVPLGLS